MSHDPHDPLRHAQRLITAAIFRRAKARTPYLSPHEEAAHAAQLEALAQLPLIGVYIDRTSHRLVISADEDHADDGGGHARALQQVLGDLPFDVVYSRFDDEAAPAKDAAARPLWGGVKMETAEAIGTLTLVVAKNGANHTLVSAHVIGRGVVGEVVGQPNDNEVNQYGLVTLNPEGPERQSDSALASINRHAIAGERDRIWRSADTAFHVVDKASNEQLVPDVEVRMQGAISVALSHGRILQTGVTSARGSGLVLVDQVLAEYPSQSGDSGGAVFLPTERDGEVIFAGIHVGTHDGHKLFSPWDGIKADLGLD